MPKARRPATRLLFDEDASPKVARALRELDFQVEHVGGKGQPPKGSSDAEVLDFTARARQTVVTRNLDMVMLCAERGVNVVWLDRQRGRRELRLDEQAALALKGITQWCDDLESARDPICIRVLTTRRHVLSVGEAAEMAAKRHYKIQARKRRPRPRQPADGQLSTDETSVDSAVKA